MLADAVVQRRIEVGFFGLFAAMFIWVLYGQLTGADSDVGFLFLCGALLVQSIAGLVPRRDLRYALLAGSLGLVAAFFIQR